MVPVAVGSRECSDWRSRELSIPLYAGLDAATVTASSEKRPDLRIRMS